MSKSNSKLNSSSNTLFNYFAKSPATPKLKPSSSNAGTPVADGTPKSVKQEKLTPTPARKELPSKNDDHQEAEEEEEVQPVKKRRRIVMDDSSENDSETENKAKNEKTPPKLTSFKRVEDSAKNGSSSISKKIKLEATENTKELPEEKEDESATILDEPTIWVHQKLDFLKPDKIKDIQGNKASSEKYDPRTLYVPESYLGTLSPVRLI